MLGCFGLFVRNSKFKIIEEYVSRVPYSFGSIKVLVCGRGRRSPKDDLAHVFS